MPIDKYSLRWNLAHENSCAFRNFGASSQFVTDTSFNENSDCASEVERRAAHNTLERQRRANLNSKFRELALALPSLQAVRHPSKSMIVTKSIEFVANNILREKDFKQQIARLCEENKRLREQVTSSGLILRHQLEKKSSKSSVVNTKLPTPGDKDKQNETPLVVENEAMQQSDHQPSNPFAEGKQQEPLSTPSAPVTDPCSPKNTTSNLPSTTVQEVQATSHDHALQTLDSSESLPSMAYEPTSFHCTPSNITQPSYAPTVPPPPNMTTMPHHSSHYPHHVQNISPIPIAPHYTGFQYPAAMARVLERNQSMLSPICYHGPSYFPACFGHYPQQCDPFHFPPPPYSQTTADEIIPSAYYPLVSPTSTSHDYMTGYPYGPKRGECHFFE